MSWKQDKRGNVRVDRAASWESDWFPASWNPLYAESGKLKGNWNETLGKTLVELGKKGNVIVGFSGFETVFSRVFGDWRENKKERRREGGLEADKVLQEQALGVCRQGRWCE
jgi:hypothetical protein